MLQYTFLNNPAAGGILAYAKVGSVKSLGGGLGSGLILALCARSMVGAAAVGSARVAFGKRVTSTLTATTMLMCFSGCVCWGPI